MYEMQDSKMGAALSDDDDRNSETPRILVMVLSALLLISFISVLAVLLIGSPDRGDNGGAGRGKDRTGAGIDGGRMPSPPLDVEIPIGPRERPSTTTVTPRRDPSTARTLSPTHPPGVQTCPTDAYCGKRIGRISSYAHAVSGFVYAASKSRIVIKNLTYDGTEPAARFWAEYKQGKSDQVAGDEIPDENGSKGALKAYTDATVHLKLPKEISAYQSLGIYSPQDNQYFGSVDIPSGYQLPKEQSLGKPASRFGNVMANEVVLTDSSTMMLRGFLNDGLCPYTYFVAAPTSLPHPEELTYLMYNGNKMGEVESYNNTDVTIQLPAGCHWNQFKWFSVYCVDTLSSLCDINIDAGAAERLPLHTPEPVVRH